ncbi:glycosyltransferase family 4 protein [Paenibacillus larvae]|uniref:Glycosyltransferase subfamily 4-like N-terminal domain-containing protein n=3 Tax=Paenibacillus larvae TaxID=1464 RepID=V9W6R3_9BACL|nr:glycosyltransferase family 4 protein [Paenibacillus larvae]AHD05818.1 hypothetical protein ERIC2_c20250 [Paenibacillus larvae subsp. larvae DSM 25430]AQR76725.1 hypothetical protein BXP28_04285 [Paenibacillus larvae subsp. larvae]AVG12356.1 PEP-CTERM/exosortase A-associated glycosyltransferase, family [Paenibacillus larvae subsp. larvae DSM 25430]ETK26746.1 hypothetical protein ERIC1_1c01740 [Paenibacillus larvae subsp. larvae DSM 25719]MCY7478093.1 glycosyltransferase family 4 protein [Pae
MKILIIAYYFPPYNTIGAVRTGKMAKYLERMGHDVRVISARDQPLQPTLHLEIPEEKVLYTHWLNINRLAQSLAGGKHKVAENGYEVSIRPGFRQNMIRFIGKMYKNILNFPDGQIGWIPFAYRAGKKTIDTWKPDLIYASSTPYSSLITAARLSRKHGIPWMAELRDLWVDHQYYHYGRIRKKLESWVEKKTLESATALVTVSEPLAEKLRARYNIPVQVIRNGFDPEDYEPAVSRERSPNLDLVYTGMVYDGKQDISPLLKAIRLLKDQDIPVRLYMYGKYLDKIRQSAAHFGVSEQVKVSGSVGYKEALRLQTEADILLLLLWTDRQEKGIYTGKLFEYIGSRRPILAVGPGENVAADLIRELGAGFIAHEEEKIVQQLKRWFLEKKEFGTIQAPSGNAGHLSRESQACQLSEFLKRLTGEMA